MSVPELLTLDPTGSDPHGEHQALHARGPATRVDLLGVTAWSVSDPVLLKKLLTGPDVSKDARQHWPQFAETVPTWPLALWVAVENMFTSFGSDHRRLRRMVAPSFSARRVAALGERVESIVDDLLDVLARTPEGEAADVRELFAYPLPIQVICHLMGVPAERRAGFRQLVDNVFATTLTPEEAAANTASLYGVLDELIAEKREQPGEDMTSLLIDARDEEGDGSALSEAELRDTLLLMISAGYETTVNLLDQAITVLLTHPEQLALVREGRANWSDVVEETLRFEPAVKHLPLRFAVRDIPLPDGQVIAKGEPVLASYAAANRHPDWHGESADTFDLTRTDPGPEHLAFGHGVHFCLGAPLARLEGITALEKFFARFPDARLGVPEEELRPVPSLISNGHQTLPVVLRPRSAAD
ncbi:cytochrome [Streptomyces qinglanensis]|uniref:Cytochrome n=1 Tax=Streptomyces qinglanensis TaxID=943816 RepID=A0A1E7K5I6_9ACTN|nr:cytochrome P450 [Streptomyces qinglanensis]OEU99169.1 cytochrome [Streptomyces qinglanensis]OEV25170.1 cytochrome [Streptomyces nanshensis]